MLFKKCSFLFRLFLGEIEGHYVKLEILKNLAGSQVYSKVNKLLGNQPYSKVLFLFK